MQAGIQRFQHWSPKWCKAAAQTGVRRGCGCVRLTSSVILGLILIDKTATKQDVNQCVSAMDACTWGNMAPSMKQNTHGHTSCPCESHVHSGKNIHDRASPCTYDAFGVCATGESYKKDDWSLAQNVMQDIAQDSNPLIMDPRFLHNPQLCWCEFCLVLIHIKIDVFGLMTKQHLEDFLWHLGHLSHFLIRIGD